MARRCSTRWNRPGDSAESGASGICRSGATAAAARAAGGNRGRLIKAGSRQLWRRALPDSRDVGPRERERVLRSLRSVSAAQQPRRTAAARAHARLRSRIRRQAGSNPPRTAHIGLVRVHRADTGVAVGERGVRAAHAATAAAAACGVAPTQHLGDVHVHHGTYAGSPSGALLGGQRAACARAPASGASATREPRTPHAAPHPPQQPRLTAPPRQCVAHTAACPPLQSAAAQRASPARPRPRRVIQRDAPCAGVRGAYAASATSVASTVCFTNTAPARQLHCTCVRARTRAGSSACAALRRRATAACVTSGARVQQLAARVHRARTHTFKSRNERLR